MDKIKILTITKKNAEFQIISALKTNRKKRSEEKELFIEGTETIKQAIAAGLQITRIIYQENFTLSDWARELINKSPEAKKIALSDVLYRELCDREDPSEIIITAKFKIYKLSDQKLPAKPFVLVIDRPGDKGNLGSIIRTSNALNIDLIIIMGHAVDVLDAKVVRSSLGSVFFTPIAFAESFNDFETWLQKQKEKSGLLLIGTDSDADIELNNFRTENPVAVLLGNEAKGISRNLHELCDQTVKIPISGNVNSLNVSCAGSIILWHLSTRNRG